MDLPPLPLDRDAGRPLAAQLADGLRAATTGGALRAGDRLPSTRALAAALGVSRTVTAAAYDQLLAEGWAEGRRGSGTFVVGAPAASRTPVPAATAAVPEGDAGLVDLSAGSPCVGALDRAAWRRAWRAAADPAPDVMPDPVGLPEFRAVVVEHLLRHRGLPAHPADVLATGGSTAAIGEVARTLPPGARVAVEEPGYQRAVTALRDAGLEVVAVPVDGAGLVVEAVPAGTAAVYCTPAHQYPLGARLSATRRVALVERARAEGFLVLEDDYDGELRYDVAPLPLLAALGPDVVAHLGTASKLLTPTLGAGWLVAPPAVRAAVLAVRGRTGGRPARAGQRVFAAFGAHGDLARHLRRLRRELSGRRSAVVAAVHAAGRAVEGDAAGAHVLVPLPGAATERAVVAAAAASGVALDGLGRHYAAPPARAGIVLGYAGPGSDELEWALPLVTEALRR
ncbi:PLP-dependent aminotransferase family protein [Pseudonocardia kunmingensis]|uniref:GntR family transcriptional regulator/MocR family aminotransferase n=1 Tax=Pseudonocardia kunmingensis TaxID=630975 RepID=A0A543DZA5_9PSEU|nr:PLP-dependent aminotransferase family protein [Pseudonocardia kunmingensis]TQM14658.1 GntR family transcriptional regulator/MocR family aminotransferase [Pseudonocardia kunmingensis]